MSSQVHPVETLTREAQHVATIDAKEVGTATDRLFAKIAPFMSIIGVITFIGQVSGKLNRALSITQVFFLLFSLFLSLPCLIIAYKHKSFSALIIGCSILGIWLLFASIFRFLIESRIKSAENLTSFSQLQRGIDSSVLDSFRDKDQLSRNVETFLDKLKGKDNKYFEEISDETNSIAYKISHGMDSFLSIKNIFAHFPWYFDTIYLILLTLIFGFSILLSIKALWNIDFNKNNWQKADNLLMLSIGVISLIFSIIGYIMWFYLSKYQIHQLWDSSETEWICKNLNEIERKGKDLTNAIDLFMKEEKEEMKRQKENQSGIETAQDKVEDIVNKIENKFEN